MSLKNFAAEQPHQHALYYTSFLLEELAWHKDELLEALDGKNKSLYLVLCKTNEGLREAITSFEFNGKNITRSFYLIIES